MDKSRLVYLQLENRALELKRADCCCKTAADHACCARKVWLLHSSDHWKLKLYADVNFCLTSSNQVNAAMKLNN